MITLNEVLKPAYNTILNISTTDNHQLLDEVLKIINKGLLVPKHKYNDKVWFLHNNQVDMDIIEGYEITQTRDIQTITYCFQHQNFNKLEEDLFETKEALIESLK